MPKLSDTAYIDETAQVKNSRFGRYVEIGAGSRVLDSDIGDYSYTDRFADIAYAQFGKFVNVAAFSRINPSEHPYTRASLHHFMYRSSYYWPDEPDEKALFEWCASPPVVIGHETWIGHGAIVMKDVKIGSGAVVASNAVVTKDFPDYAIVAGVPAKFLKWRHEPAIAERLLQLAWWD